MKLIESIMQTWKAEELPGQYRSAVDTWKLKHPSWDHRLIDDTALLAWLDNHDRQFGFIKERLQPFVRVADLFEYAWLFEYGGLFVDLDFVAVRALDPLILSVDGEVLLGTVEMPNLRLRPRNRVPNAFMYSAVRGHELWAVALFPASQRKEEQWPEKASGPMLLLDAVEWLERQHSREQSGEQSKAFDEWCDRHAVHPTSSGPVTLLPPRYLYPVSWGLDGHADRLDQLRTIEDFRQQDWVEYFGDEDTHAFTFWAHSWGDQVEGA